MYKMQELIYPISLNYRAEWGPWEAIRELVQNCMDETKEFSIRKTHNGLVIEDKGEGLQLRHLIFGITEKKDGEKARGKFGEGLKLALIVLKRLGYDVVIRSNGLRVTVAVAVIAGERCLKLEVDEVKSELSGTQITVRGYKGDTFDDKFVNGNKTKLFTCAKGDIIDESVKALYVKDIFVCKLEKARYSYNIKEGIRLAEDRNIPDEYSVQTGIGNLYASIGDSGKDLVIELFKAIKTEKYESTIKLWWIAGTVRKMWQEAFREVYGANAVVQTDSDWEREANWRGAKVVHLPMSMGDLSGYLITDKQFVLKDNSAKGIRVADEDLTKAEFRNLMILRKLALRMDEAVTVNAYLQEKLAVFTADSEVKIRRTELRSLEKALDDLIHELAHAEGTKDLTTEMILKVSQVGAALLYPFVKKMRVTNNLKGEVVVTD